MSALLNGMDEGMHTFLISVQDMVGRVLHTSSCIFTPSTVGQGGRGQASVGDDAVHRDAVAQQAQQVKSRQAGHSVAVPITLA
jgi:hypothetical protein